MISEYKMLPPEIDTIAKEYILAVISIIGIDEVLNHINKNINMYDKWIDKERNKICKNNDIDMYHLIYTKERSEYYRDNFDRLLSELIAENKIELGVKI